MTEMDLEDLVYGKPCAVTDFRPMATYSRQGDCIEFLLTPESFRAERLDSLVTVYYGRESKEVVGSLIKGVSGLIAKTLDRCPGFKIEIRGGRVKLSHLFTAGLWTSAGHPNGTVIKVYDKLREAAERDEVSAEAAELCRG